MLKSHLDAVEQLLLANSKIPHNAGHTIHRGTPRESFIRDFLSGHLSAKLAIGTGEIIDASSKPRESRNQFDIVVYKYDYPKIVLGGGINAFLAESVVATIEVKSLLTKEELKTAVSAASKAKRAARNLSTVFQAGWIPSNILSFVVAYDGPVHTSTVYDWLIEAEGELGLNRAPLPPTADERRSLTSESLDGIICLGRGSIIHDSSPLTVIDDKFRIEVPSAKRTVIENMNGNLMWIFLILTAAASNSTAQWPDLTAYIGNLSLDKVNFAD